MTLPVRVSLTSLGCPKNLVDSEEMLGALVASGYELEPDAAKADAVVVNTCGFIESAKEESIEAILGAAQLKSGGRCRSVIVAGCLAQRYGRELAGEMPEVDAFIGVGKNGELPQVIRRALAGERTLDSRPPATSWMRNGHRVRSTPPWMAYLRVADGCSNRCSYCAIPDIRGPFRSRPPDLVLAEAERMAKEGVLEVNLVGQDITRYGEDLSGDSILSLSNEPSRGGWNLERLVREIAATRGLRWIRLLYCHPTRITDGLLELLATEPKVCKYMDIPLQHGDDRVLAEMNRRGTRSDYLSLLLRIWEACPEVALRTSFIVGFPSEGGEEFENLLSFVEEISFDRVGAFKYSREDGTPAASMPKQVPRSVAARRYDRLMALAQRISAERNRMMIGREIEVLVEAPGAGRSYRDAPEIDGTVRLTGEETRPGEMVWATVTKTGEYDIEASVKRDAANPLLPT
jgi:ribosomal protein S12 methylthiotransferase